MRWKCAVVSLVSVTNVWASDQVTTPEVKTEKAIISGKQTDIEEERDSVAGKIIVGRERIANSGVKNVGELLAREPAVSIGKDGRIGLLGLPGYTQILVDGVKPQRDIAEMDLSEVERIEIIKSSTASTGPVGIAGTINLIRRKVARKVSTQAQISTTQSAGKNRADLSLSTNQVSQDSPLSYNLRMSAFHAPSIRQSNYYQESIGLSDESVERYRGDVSSSSLAKVATAGASIDWKFSPAHTFNLSPQLAYSALQGHRNEERWWDAGQSLVVQTQNKNPVKMYELPLRWSWKVNRDSQVQGYLKVNGMDADASAIRDEAWSSARSTHRVYEETSRSKNTFANLDFSTSTEDGHEISAGIKLTRNRTRDRHSDYLNGQLDASLSMFSPDEFAKMDGARLFIEDQWRISRFWSLNAGLSIERRWYESSAGDQRGAHAFDMVAPSLHVARKFGAKRKQQVRLSLSRSFQPPDVADLRLRPVINAFAPCPVGNPCGANTIDTADEAPNPSLQAERALGVNLSYSHGIGKNSEWSAEVYSRDLKGKIGNAFALENVAWAQSPRFVYRKANLGNARIRGVNLEGRLSGQDVSETWAHIDLYGNLGFADSALSDIPGPDNRIDGQTPWNFKLGGSYKNPALPFGFGVDVSLLPATWIRHNLEQRTFDSKRLTLGANAKWVINKRSKLFVNLNNMTSPSTSRVDEYRSTHDRIIRTTRGVNHSRLTLRYEVEL